MSKLTNSPKYTVFVLKDRRWSGYYLALQRHVGERLTRRKSEQLPELLAALRPHPEISCVVGFQELCDKRDTARR